MGRMTREQFLKVGSLAALTPFTSSLMSTNFNTMGMGNDVALLKQLLLANGEMVRRLLSTITVDNNSFSRNIGNEFSALAAAYCHKESVYYHQKELIDKLLILVARLHKFQTTDGTVNIGNLESPPDTAFLIELLAPGLVILRKDGTEPAMKVYKEAEPFMKKVGEALVTGGVHTPNHRWVVSAALSQLYDLYKEPAYIHRINDWLGEGIYQDADGHYPERSIIYAGVENTAFTTLGRMLDQSAFFDHVRKNLRMLYYYMEPDGQMVTTDSRRQDQYTQKDALNNYYSYRHLAIRDNDQQFGAIVRFMEQMPEFKESILQTGLYHFMENESLLQELPAPTVLNTSFEKHFASTALLRIRRGDTTATFFGGVDWPVIIASGRSNSPNFFSYRKGKAILHYMRLSTAFFSTGYFYSEGLEKRGNTYVLHKKLEVPYYQPLPKELRRKDGDYTLSPSIDGRFWNKMDFNNRPVSNVKTLDTTITLQEENGAISLQFDVKGLADVPVTIELCFGTDGKVRGVSAPLNDNYFLEAGMGTFEVDGDKIEFGPGNMAHKNISNLAGERYSTHFGSLRTEGTHVYITGITPLQHTLNFR